MISQSAGLFRPRHDSGRTQVPQSYGMSLTACAVKFLFHI